MNQHKNILFTALLGLSLLTAHAAPIAFFDFSDAPTSVGTGAANTTSAATTLAPGLGSASFTVVRNNTTAENQSGIANVAGSSNVGAAQISGAQTNTYGWEDGSTTNFFEFTVNFGSISATDITFDELVLNGRTGVEWTSTGTINNYASNRRSSITLRSSLDNFEANIGGEINPSFTNTNNDWVTTRIDLSGLVLAGTEDSTTFRIYTRSDTPTETGNSLFNRTQFNSVELTGVAIPEPGTLVLVGIALGSLLLFRRKMR